MVNISETPLLTYRQARERQRSHAVWQSEVPVEFAVSLPLPTKRWTKPGYAQFASPAVRMPEKPIDQGVPDRWWVFDAHSGRVIAFALCAAVPFAAESTFSAVTLPVVKSTLDELRQAHADLEAQMETAAPAFFAGLAIDAAAAGRLSKALASVIPAPLLPQYRALTPDFFLWLEA